MRTFLLFVLGAFVALQLRAQDTLSLDEQWALLEAELDSFAIFNALDSLLTAKAEVPSEVNLRISYNSNITSAGRNYGINQHGIAPGIAYYDKTGLWADVSGYWNSEAEPQYNLTIISGGYLDFFQPKWSYGLSYERWIFHDSEALFENSMGASTSYNFGPISANLDYSFLFGSETANRFIGSLYGNINTKAWWIFDRISVNPTATLIVGNDNVTTFNLSTNERLTELFLLTQLDSEELDTLLVNAVLSGRLTRDEAQQIRRRIRNLSDEELDRLMEAVFIEDSESVFSVLNYSFSLPVTLSAKKFFLMLAYTYSIPVKLPGEEVTLDPIGYFSISFNYRLPTK